MPSAQAQWPQLLLKWWLPALSAPHRSTVVCGGWKSHHYDSLSTRLGRCFGGVADELTDTKLPHAKFVSCLAATTNTDNKKAN